MCKPYLDQVLLRRLSIYLPVIDSLTCVVWFSIDKGLKRVHFYILDSASPHPLFLNNGHF